MTEDQRGVNPGMVHGEEDWDQTQAQREEEEEERREGD